MEGIKIEFSAQINEQGVLRMGMLEFKQAMKRYPNKKAVVTVEILDGGDVEMMRSRYRNYILPKVVEAYRDLGENYTSEQADRELVKHTTVRKKTVLNEEWIIALEDMDRELLKRWTDEVTIFCSMNLWLTL